MIRLLSVGAGDEMRWLVERRCSLEGARGVLEGVR